MGVGLDLPRPAVAPGVDVAVADCWAAPPVYVVRQVSTVLAVAVAPCTGPAPGEVEQVDAGDAAVQQGLVGLLQLLEVGHGRGVGHDRRVAGGDRLGLLPVRLLDDLPDRGRDVAAPGRDPGGRTARQLRRGWGQRSRQARAVQRMAPGPPRRPGRAGAGRPRRRRRRAAPAVPRASHAGRPASTGALEVSVPIAASDGARQLRMSNAILLRSRDSAPANLERRRAPSEGDQANVRER